MEQDKNKTNKNPIEKWRRENNTLKSKVNNTLYIDHLWPKLGWFVLECLDVRHVLFKQTLSQHDGSTVCTAFQKSLLGNFQKMGYPASCPSSSVHKSELDMVG